MPRASTSPLLATPRGLVLYYGCCAVLCVAMTVAILQCEVRYAMTANDADVRQECDVGILAVRSIATCLYAAICVPALSQLLQSALLAHDTFAELTSEDVSSSASLPSLKERMQRLVSRSVAISIPSCTCTVTSARWA